MVDRCLDYNGVFKSNHLVQHIFEHDQRMRYCGVNMHHQNFIAERSIRMVSEISRSVMLHSSLLCENGIGSNLWTVDTSYNTYIYNCMTNAEDIVPSYLFPGTNFPCHKLKDIHGWGFPVYVLNPTLQQGRKLLKWHPQSCRRILVGFNPNHSGNVHLILNKTNVQIPPPFHVIFDDSFNTVLSLSPEE